MNTPSNIVESLLRPNIKRDIIGYVIPGLFFLLITFLLTPNNHYVYLSISEIIISYPFWFSILSIIILSYCLGQIGSSLILFIYLIIIFLCQYVFVFIHKLVVFFKKKDITGAKIFWAENSKKFFSEKEPREADVDFDFLSAMLVAFCDVKKDNPIHLELFNKNMLSRERKEESNYFWRAFLGISLIWTFFTRYIFLENSIFYFIVYLDIMISILSLFRYLNIQMRLRADDRITILKYSKNKSSVEQV